MSNRNYFFATYTRLAPNLQRMVRGGLVVLWLLGMMGTQLVNPAPVAYAAPGPFANVSASMPGTVLIGNAFSFSLTFSNPSPTPTDVGYGPFIDVVFPTAGIDGRTITSTVSPADGISFVNATYLGQAVTAQVLTFPDDNGPLTGTVGTLNHPYLVNTLNQPITVTGQAGDTLVVLQLPFGSFVPGQTPVQITVNAQLSNLADLGAVLNFHYRGGYMYGATPLNDWCCDAPIVSHSANDNSTWPPASVTPDLFALTKDNPMHESETATGPNYPYSYTLGVDVPTGQQVTNVLITDTMPNNAAYVTGTLTATPPGFTILDQPLPGANNPPNNDLRLLWPGPLTGAAGDDATASFGFFIPLSNASGANIVNSLTGACATSTNTAAASVTWTPIDVRDLPTPISANATAPSVEACALVGQKGASIFTDIGAPGATPGDIVRFTLDFQVSDFFAFNNVVLTDTLSDGWHFYTGTAPSLLFNGNTFTLTTAAMNPANLTVIDHWTGAPAPVAPLTGTTDIVFNISGEVLSRTLGAQTNLLGGCVPTTGTATPDCAVYNDGATTGQIVFFAEIQDQFTDNFPSGDTSVDHGDVLNNDMTVAGAVLATTAGFAPTGFTATDTSGASLSVAFGNLTKTIYAINGSTGFTNTEIAPGYTVTYRIRYTMPSSDFENTKITDFLPLPIYHSSEFTNFAPVSTSASATPPPAGRYSFGPLDTVISTFGVGMVPTFTIDATLNTLTFDYGTFDDPLNRNTEIDLLFTVTASNEPFADKLLLTNQVNVTEGTTNASTQSVNDIRQVTLTEPVLRFGKAVVASDNPLALFAPTPPGPVTFNAPGTAGVRWAGTIDSNNIVTNPINSNVSNVDAGDRVTFAIIIENIGSSPNGAFDVGITDTLQVGYVIPAGGLNLQVFLGDGTGPIAFTGQGGGPDTINGTPDDLFGAGIILTDNPTTGVCQAHTIGGGKNIVVITYDLELASTVQPNQPIINLGTLGRYAGTEGGPNHVTSPITDTAVVTVSAMGLAKNLVGTELLTANNALTQTAIGEVVTYTVTLTAPEGIASNVIVTDTLDAGLTFGNALTVSASAGVTFSGNPLAPATAGQNVIFSFGTLTNTNTNNAITETVTLTYTAIVANVAGNQDAPTTLLNNSATLGWSGNALTYTVVATNVTVIEPVLTLSKARTPATADGGDPITFTLTLTNTAGTNRTDAYNVVLTDVVPTGMTYVPGSLANVSGTAPTTLNDAAAPTLTVAWDTLALNASSTISFVATVNTSVVPAQVVNNTGVLNWTSMPGANANERNGSGGTNNYTTTASASVTILSVGTSKALTQTSEIHTPNNDAAIGEVVRFALAITVPEVTAPNFQIADFLPVGLMYLNDGSTLVAFVSNGGGITSTVLNTGLPGCANLNLTGAASNVMPTCPLPGAQISGGPFADGTDPFFNLGTLVNSDNDADGEFVVLEFNAVVSNIAGNVGGTIRANQFQVRINAVANGPNSNNVQVIVREPSIPFTANTKTVTPTSGDAGDVVTYTVIFTNASGVNNTTAFDMVFTDSVPAAVLLTTPGTLTSSGTVTNVVDASAGNQITVTADAMAAGARLTLVYTGTLQSAVRPGELLINDARIVYSSLPVTGTLVNPTGSVTPGGSGSGTGERNGSGVAPNNYNGADTATVTINSPTMSKVIVATNQTHTTGTNVAIGEIITYNVTITVPEGTTNSAVVTDTLDAGLAYVDCLSVTASAAITTTLGDFTGVCAATNAAVVNPGRNLTFTLGNLLNSDNNNAVSETIGLTYTVVVLNQAGNVAGTPLNNAAAFLWNNGAPRSITASAPNVIIVEPVFAIAKTVIPASADAGDTVTFTLTITNQIGANRADAFEIVLTDVVPAGVTYVAGSLANVSGVAAGLDDSAAPALTLTWPSLTVNQTSVLSFTAQLNGSVGPGQIITNTGRLTWTGLPTAVITTQTPYNTVGVERTGDTTNPGGAMNTYTATASAGVTVLSGGLVKSLESTSAAHTVDPDVTIGEIVTYTLVITLPEGTIGNLVVTDTLPLGLAYVSGSGQTDTTGFNGVLPAPTITCGACGDGDDVTFTFINTTVTGNNDPADNAFRIRLQAQVLDVPGNVGVAPQTVLPNTVSEKADVAPVNTSNTVTVTVVEPRPAITKGITPAQAAANDTITVTLAVTNTGLSTSFDTVVEDALPAALVNVQEISTPAGFTFITATLPGPQTVVTYTGGTLTPGQSAVFIFTAQLASNVTAGNLIVNTASVTQSTTLSGTVTGERNELPVSSTATVTVVAPELSIFKTDGGATALPGGQVLYTITYSNTGGSIATNVILTDVVPAQTSFNAAGSTPGWQFTSITAGSSITINVGAVPADSVVRAVTFTVDVGNPVPAGFTILSNAVDIGDDGTHGVELTKTNNIFTETTPLVTHPDLAIFKTDGGATALPGGQVLYTITYSNTGDVGATNVILTDTVPAQTSFNAAGSTPGWQFTSITAGNPITINVGTVPAGASGAVTFTVDVGNPVPAGFQLLSNAVRVGDDGTNGTEITTTNNIFTDTTPLVTHPDLAIFKTDGGATALPGGQVLYTITYSNTGDVGATNVILTDTVPAQTSFNVAGSTPGWQFTSITAGNPITINVGTVPAGASGAVTFTVDVGNPVPAGFQLLSNAVRVGDDGTNGTEITTTNNIFTDTTPLTTTPDLAIFKTDGGATALPGGQVLYTITYSNTGDVGATNVILTDTVPADTTFNAAGSTPGWQFTSITAGSPITINVGAVPSGASGAVTFTVDVNASIGVSITVLSNAVQVGDDGTNGSEITTTNNIFTETTPVSGLPNLTVFKTDGGATALPGGQVLYTITFTNTGNITATNVVMTDVVPAQTSFNAANSTPGWTFTSITAGSFITINVGTLTPGANGAVTFTVDVNTPIPAGFTVLSNAVDIGDDGTHGNDSNPADNQSTDTTPLTSRPELVIFKTDGGATALPGGQVLYTITYSNTGNVGATNVILTDTVPAQTTFNAAGSTPGWQFTSITAGSPITINVGTVPADSVTRAVTFTVDVGNPVPAGFTILSNAVQIGDDGTNGTEITTTNNIFTDTTPLSGAPDMQISKTDNGVTASPGGVVTYTLTYTNTGNRGASNVTLTETVPANTSFNANSSLPQVWSCANGSAAGTTCTLNVGTVAGGGGNGSARFAVTVNNPLSSTITALTNTVSIGDDGTNGIDLTPPNNISTEGTPIQPPTAVEWAYVRAVAVGPRTVRVQWATLMEVDNYGFHIYRASVNDPSKAVLVHFESAASGAANGAEYTFADAVPAPGVYWYWVTDIDTSSAEASLTARPAVSALVPGFWLYLPFVIAR